MDASFNFLIQSTRLLYDNKYDNQELEMIYDFVRSLEDDELIDYHNTCTILTYENDLELYIEVIQVLIKIFEVREEYEKCQILQEKLIESIKIKNEKTI